MEAKQRKAYPSDVSDEEWAFVAPYFASRHAIAGRLKISDDTELIAEGICHDRPLDSRVIRRVYALRSH